MPYGKGTYGKKVGRPPKKLNQRLQKQVGWLRSILNARYKFLNG
tara:strand:+ start:676 stop:807 length:132 start_codon:yes stop_codon:yes gene_type:complete